MLERREDKLKDVNEGLAPTMASRETASGCVGITTNSCESGGNGANYLAPDIVVTILNGRQPAGLTVSLLISDSRLPLEWSAQRAALGISLKRDPRKYSG